MNWKRLAAKALFGKGWFNRSKIPAVSGAAIDKKRIKRALESARQGDTRELSAFQYEMRATSSDLGSHIRKIELALQQTPMEISQWPPSKPGEKKSNSLADTIAADCREQLLHPDLDMADVIAHALWSLLCGHGGFEMQIEGDRISALTPVPPERYWWENGVMLVQTGEDVSTRQPVEDLGASAPTLVVSPSAIERDLVGVMRTCVTPWMTARWGLEWWGSAVERGGEPFRYASYQPADDPEALLEKLKTMGSGGIGVFPAGVDLKFLENASTFAARPHQELVEHCERAMAKAILGGTQTADIQANAGSKSSAGVHQDIFEMFVDGYGLGICGFLRRSVLRPYVVFKYGEQAAPYTPMPVLRTPRYNRLLAFFTALKEARAAGLETIPVAWVHAQSGIPMPEEGEAVLKAPAAPVPAKAAVRASRLPGLSVGLPELEDWAGRVARGSGEELTNEIEGIIEQAERDGASLDQLFSRVIQRSGLPPESPRLMDLLAGVQLEATMRGFTSRR